MFDLNRDGLARGEPIEPREAVHPSVPVPDVVGKSAAMREPLQTVARVGPKDVTILIHGETGTGSTQRAPARRRRWPGSTAAQFPSSWLRPNRSVTHRAHQGSLRSCHGARLNRR